MSNQDNLKMTARPDGFLFELRDGAYLLAKWSSAKQVQVEMWRGTDYLAPDTGNIYTASFRSKLARTAQERFGKDNVPNIAEDIDNVAIALGSAGPSGKTLHQQLEETAGPSVTDRLVLYARKRAKFFSDSEQQAYATVKAKGANAGAHVETHPVNSRAFRLWLRNEFWRIEREKREEAAAAADGAIYAGDPTVELPEVIRDQALADAIAQIEGLALYEGARAEVFLRVAGKMALGEEDEDAIFIDMCDEDWRAIKVTAKGWEIVPSEEVAKSVKFIRRRAMLPLPEPKRGGSLDELRKLLNLEGEEGERNWRLILAWLVWALTPSGPFPVLTLLGPQGSSKSTTQRYLRALIDPNKAALRRKPREERDIFIAAKNSWVVSLNNLSGVPQWLSDSLCTIAADGGYATRMLYENDEEIIFEHRRPIAVNGIGDVLTHADLLDRALIVNLPAIEKKSRKEERALNAAFEAAWPYLLGALLDGLVAGLAGWRDVDLEEKSRMADFERFAVATEEALGGEKGGFMAAYRESQATATDTALESWPIAAPLWKFARVHEGKENAWTGTASALLEVLNDRAGDDLRRAQEWPKQPNKLAEQLKRLSPAMKEMGVHILRPTRSHKGGRKIMVFYKSQDSETFEGTMGDDAGDDAHEVTVPPETPIDKPNPATGDDGDDGDGTFSGDEEIEI